MASIFFDSNLENWVLCIELRLHNLNQNPMSSAPVIILLFCNKNDNNNI